VCPWLFHSSTSAAAWTRASSSVPLRRVAGTCRSQTAVALPTSTTSVVISGQASLSNLTRSRATSAARSLPGSVIRSGYGLSRDAHWTLGALSGHAWKPKTEVRQPRDRAVVTPGPGSALRTHCGRGRTAIRALIGDQGPDLHFRGGAEGTRTPDPHTARAEGGCPTPSRAVRRSVSDALNRRSGPSRTTVNRQVGHHRGTTLARPASVAEAGRARLPLAVPAPRPVQLQIIDKPLHGRDCLTSPSGGIGCCPASWGRSSRSLPAQLLDHLLQVGCHPSLSLRPRPYMAPRYLSPSATGAPCLWSPSEVPTTVDRPGVRLRRAAWAGLRRGPAGYGASWAQAVLPPTGSSTGP